MEQIRIVCRIGDVDEKLSQMTGDGWELVSVLPSSEVISEWDDGRCRDVDVRYNTRELYFKRTTRPASRNKPRPVPMNPKQR